jgi:hypothetical protein
LFQKTFDNAILECKNKGLILSAPETIEENICVQWMILEKGEESIFKGTRIEDL